jgi:hypothetical protein
MNLCRVNGILFVALAYASVRTARVHIYLMLTVSDPSGLMTLSITFTRRGGTSIPVLRRNSTNCSISLMYALVLVSGCAAVTGVTVFTAVPPTPIVVVVVEVGVTDSFSLAN